MSLPILCLDFDGVIHSYTSGWTNARTIPDPPVPGALEFIEKAQEQFRVHIHSSRSHQWGGRSAMKSWLKLHFRLYYEETDTRLQYYSPKDKADQIVSELRFPIFKPPAFITIDDRAIQFLGIWPELEYLTSFKPWNKK